MKNAKRKTPTRFGASVSKNDRKKPGQAWDTLMVAIWFRRSLFSFLSQDPERKGYLSTNIEATREGPFERTIVFQGPQNVRFSVCGQGNLFGSPKIVAILGKTLFGHRSIRFGKPSFRKSRKESGSRLYAQPPLSKSTKYPHLGAMHRKHTPKPFLSRWQRKDSFPGKRPQIVLGLN